MLMDSKTQYYLDVTCSQFDLQVPNQTLSKHFVDINKMIIKCI